MRVPPTLREDDGQTRPDAWRPMRAAESSTTAPSSTAPVTMNLVGDS